MQRVALKLLVYLSILTSTRTSSSYLDPQSLVNFRRSAVGANPLMLSAQEQQQQRLGPEIYETNPYEWQPTIESEKGGEISSNFVQQLVNANKNMLYTQPSNTNNNRRANKKLRKSRKDSRNSSNKQLYENHIKRKNSLSVSTDEALPNDENVPSEALSSSEIVNDSNNFESISSNHTKHDKYSSAHIDPQHERELQELFGIEGGKKYQEYQLKQQMLIQQLDKSEKALDEFKEGPQKRRDSSQGSAEELQDVSGAMINQMMSRSTRRQREYDVPLIREYFFSLKFVVINLLSRKKGETSFENFYREAFKEKQLQQSIKN